MIGNDGKRMGYREFFKELTGHLPFPYQERVAKGEWPSVINVPTGLGKTEAVLAAWLHRLLEGERRAGLRLVYCLPMRVLVNQTADVATRLCERAHDRFVDRGLAVPTVHRMLGGFVDEEWEMRPERPAVLVGTQDMLLSRALARGYAMSRFKWPVHFGLLHTNCLWVFDEVQLMGVAVETSAQLQGLRRTLGTVAPTHSVWMSATVDHGRLDTIDHPAPASDGRLGLDESDRAAPLVNERTSARKPLTAADIQLKKGGAKAYVAALSQQVAVAHRERGDLTLVIVNRVDRAQALYRTLGALGVQPLALVHSRFRPPDRAHHEAMLHQEGSRVVVATQAVEAGVDVSARTLFTELAPWPSLIQRFGRCNRYGRDDEARIVWIDLDAEQDAGCALPYESTELARARELLDRLDDAGPDRLAAIPYAAPAVPRPVLRRRDLLDLFDTSADLLGNDIDISRYVRDGEDTDVHVYFRAWQGDPDETVTAPTRDDLVRVSIGAMRTFVAKVKKKRKSLGSSERDRLLKTWLRAWRLDPLASPPWTQVDDAHPGHVVVLHAAIGGYDAELGWTGDLLPGQPVPTDSPVVSAAAPDRMDADPRASRTRWIPLATHLVRVATEAERLSAAVGLDGALKRAVTTAALWHDVGKVHPDFQHRLVGPVQDDPARAPPGPGPWAKSAHRRKAPRDARPYFRHELASALAWRQLQASAEDRDLVAYLIAAHHGKVRLSIRSVPDEQAPSDPERLFARGIWDGDELSAVRMPDGTTLGPVTLDLSPMQLGEDSWLECCLGLRDDPALGPFRLGHLEALVRIADWRASRAEERRDG